MCNSEAFRQYRISEARSALNDGDTQSVRQIANEIATVFGTEEVPEFLQSYQTN